MRFPCSYVENGLYLNLDLIYIYTLYLYPFQRFGRLLMFTVLDLMTILCDYL